MKINANKKILQLNGEPFQDQKGLDLTVGWLIADILCIEPSEIWKPLKAIAVAERFNKKGMVDLDESDLGDLKKIVENSKRAPIVLGRVLQILNSTSQVDPPDDEIAETPKRKRHPAKA